MQFLSYGKAPERGTIFIPKDRGDDFFGGENPSYLGFQGGIAFFLGDMVSIEPSIRYNLSLNSDSFENIFQAQIGFSIFL